MPMRAGPAIAITIASLLAAPLAANSAEHAIKVAIGTPGSDSFAFGTELWAMSQLSLAHAHGIGLEPEEIGETGERLAQLLERQVDAALIHGRIPASKARDVRAIMALWPNGRPSIGADPVQLVVHEHVSEDAIYHITKAIFENAALMKSARATLGIAPPGDAITGLDVPLHPGAYRYYEERGHGLAATASRRHIELDTPTPAPGLKVSKSVTYRDFDHSALNEAEIAQIVAACRQALDVGSLSPVLGDLSSTGCEVYQEQLASARAVAPAGDDQALFSSPVGQGGPAIVLDSDSAYRRSAQHSARQQTELLSRQPVM